LAERVTITIRGVVQGVGFRWHAQRQAAALGLTGTVRNRPDGAVAIVAEGEREALAKLVTWARQGPPRAGVRDVEVTWGEADGRFPGFAITG